jgi:glycerol-3-phosphate acyltransferase PlsY
MESFFSQTSLLLFSAGAYLLGSIPFGKMIGQKIARIDITQHGSGNIGATNVARALGMKFGIITLILDTLKGAVPILLVKMTSDSEMAIAAVGLTALLGHQFSIFLKFRGGKGVATALGVFLAVSPQACIAALILFILSVSLFDYVSLGSLVSAASMPIILYLFHYPAVFIVQSLIIALLICFKHGDNIRRLINGNERRWRRRDTKSEIPKDDSVPHQSRSG